MAFLLNAQALGVSSKNEQSPWRGASEARGPMQLHRLHRLKAGPGRSFLAEENNSGETFLRGLFACSIAETNRSILGQDMINPKRTTQWSVMQQRNVSHSAVGIVASGYAMPGSDIGSQF